jgi:CheY-like chemotaxis protein
MQELHDRFQPIAAQKQLAFALDIDPLFAHTQMWVDKLRFIQIFASLLTNAIKFTETGGIKFGYSVYLSQSIFFVQDTGCVIAPENIELIFERFTRNESPILKQTTGSGLGLAICKGLITLMEGVIWVESELDKGSTFYFQIPNIFINQAQNTVPIQLHTTHNKMTTVLIAEDEYINYFYLSEVLAMEQIKCIHAKNGKEAVDICAKDSSIDLVLMDIRMPVMDGYEAAEKIKKLLPNLPIIAQTAYASADDRLYADRIGFSEFLTKPIRKEVLVETVLRFTQNT